MKKGRVVRVRLIYEENCGNLGLWAKSGSRPWRERIGRLRSDNGWDGDGNWHPIGRGCLTT